MSQMLWQPSMDTIRDANLTRFMDTVNKTQHQSVENYPDLYQYSVDFPEQFWSILWDFAPLIASKKGDVVLEKSAVMKDSKWFPDATLNYAQNLLRERDADAPMFIFRGEDQVEQIWRYAEVHQCVSKTIQALQAMGVKKDDRVAGYMPNMPHTIMMMLAATSMGAVWTSCSPDFGVTGVVDRFGQVKPKVMICVDGYYYNGKVIPCLDKVAQISDQIDSIEKVLVVPYTDLSLTQNTVASFGESLKSKAVLFSDFIAPYSAKEIEYAQLAFNHPLFIMYSSGTTGAPKCIVHGAGGTLLQHLKEHLLHTDIKPGERLFYYSTCGWMMWNWLVSGLASGATLMLYDGSPFYPSPTTLFDFAQDFKINVFGTSAKYIEALDKAGVKPMQSHDLSDLKAVLSTGSPLSPQGFQYVYEHIKSDVCLSSISGGTDIVSCFALGCPILPVYTGELQCVGLALDIKALDHEGKECATGEKGELACIAPFPCMPIGFWDDPKGEKYHQAYFDRIDNVWCHGDYIELTVNGGMIIHGRSDAVLNPGGVRIGTAEIYRQVEKINEVLESIVIGQQWQDDVRVVLFVKLQPNQVLDENLKQVIKKTIRSHTTPRHVPAIILQVNDIPRTKSGKIVELAVRNIVHGEAIKNVEALANPEALEEYANRAELNE